jgi:hypothetical protein
VFTRVLRHRLRERKNLQVRQRGVPASRVLHVRRISQGRLLPLLPCRVQRTLPSPTPRLLRRLPRSRHLDGHNVERRRYHGRCSPPDRYLLIFIFNTHTIFFSMWSERRLLKGSGCENQRKKRKPARRRMDNGHKDEKNFSES